MGTWWGRCEDVVAVVAVLDSGVQPKLTGAHGPERPKAAYGRIIALNSADSTLSSESPGQAGLGGLHGPPTPFKGGWAGGASPQGGSLGSHVARLVSHLWGSLVPRAPLCAGDVPPVPCVPSCPPSLASSPAPAQPAGWGHGTGWGHI